MLAVHDPKDYDNLIPLQFDEDNAESWHVKHAYNGVDTLTFEISTNSKYYKYLVEEGTIEFTGGRDKDSRFLIKNIDEHSDFVTVDAEIDLDDWRRDVIESFRETNSYLYQVLDKIIPPGWTYNGSGFSDKRTTVEASEGEPFELATRLEILDAASSAYDRVFNFDVVNCVLTVVDPDSQQPTGEYFTDELNLNSFGFVGNTDGFATRLYAYGVADEDTGERLTFASINDGKTYIDDNTYTDKVVCVGWVDDRYTTAEGLLEASKAKLKDLAVPVRSYSCEVSYFKSNVWLYKVVTLIDRRRGTRVDHQVIEWTEYESQSRDEVTLSAVPPSIESLVSKVESSFNEALDNSNLNMNKVVSAAVKHATEMITGSHGGYFKWLLDDEGNPIELVNLADSEDLNSAQKVWRWNQAGLGHSNNGYEGPYDLALLADGSINASMITTGVLNASVIKAGILQDLTGQNYWNMESGEFRLAPGSTIGDSEIASKSDTISNVDVEYALGDTNTTAPTSGWSTDSVQWTEGKYIWQRTVTTMQDGTKSISDPVCIQPATGASGDDGVGILQYQEEYYLSTSDTELSGGTWSTLQPAWVKGKYIWTSTVVNWTDGSTTRTPPVLASAINGANETADEALEGVSVLDESLNQQEIFNRLTNNGQTQGIFLSNGLLYLNASYISTGTLNANLIKAGILSDKSGKNTWNMVTGEMRLQGLDIYIEDAASSAADSAANDALTSAKDYADSVGSSTLTSSKNYTNTTVNTLIRLTSQGVEVGSTSSDMKSIVGAGSFLFKNGSTTILNMSGGTGGNTVSFKLPSYVGFRFESSNAAIFYANPNGYSFSSQRPSFRVHGVAAVETLTRTPSSQTNTTTIDISAFYNFSESVEYVVIYYRCTWSGGYHSLKVKLEQGQSRDTYLIAEAAQSNGIVFSHEGITLQLSGNSFTITRGVTLDRRFSAAYPDNAGYKDATAIDWSPQFYIYQVNFCG